MSVIDKIKPINNKIEQNKVQCDLDRQTAKISALSSGNVSKYEFLTARMFFQKRHARENCCNQKI